MNRTFEFVYSMCALGDFHVLDLSPQQIRVKGGRQVWQLGDVEVDLNPDFRFYLQTELANADYGPEVGLGFLQSERYHVNNSAEAPQPSRRNITGGGPMHDCKPLGNKGGPGGAVVELGLRH